MLEELLFDKSEKIISVLGSGIVQNFLLTGKIKRGFAVLSDRRIYFKGNCLVKRGRTYYISHEERAVDLKDVTGTGFIYYRNPLLLWGGIALILLPFIILFIAAITTL